MARLGRPFAALLPTPKEGSASPTLLRRIKAMLALAPNGLPARGPVGGSVFPAIGERRGRVALLQGCAQQVLAPRINQAAINLLTRHGVEVVLVKDEQCCGALTHHLGHDGDALARARANVSVWQREAEQGGLDAILVTTSGCGTVIKDYGFMLREDREFAGPAARISALARISPNISPASSCFLQGKTATSPSPIIRLVRCSTDRKSQRFRKNCFPRMDSW